MTTTQPNFTEEAQKRVKEETRWFSEKLQEEAAKEAFSARGRPVEVTAADIRKAKQALLGVNLVPQSIRKMLSLYQRTGMLILLVGVAWLFFSWFYHSGQVVTSQYFAPVALILLGATFLAIVAVYPRLRQRLFGRSPRDSQSSKGE